MAIYVFITTDAATFVHTILPDIINRMPDVKKYTFRCCGEHIATTNTE